MQINWMLSAPAIILIVVGLVLTRYYNKEQNNFFALHNKYVKECQANNVKPDQIKTQYFAAKILRCQRMTMVFLAVMWIGVLIIGLDYFFIN